MPDNIKQRVTAAGDHDLALLIFYQSQGLSDRL